MLTVVAAAPAVADDRPAPKPLWDAYPLDTGRVVRSHTPAPRLVPVRPAVRPATLSHDDGAPSPVWWIMLIAGSAVVVYLAAHRRPSPVRARTSLAPSLRRHRPARRRTPRDRRPAPPPDPVAEAPPPPRHVEPEVRWLVTGGGSRSRTTPRFARRYRVADDPPDKEV